MYLQLILIFLFLKYVYAYLNTTMIIDYFAHKEISSVVGYSCNLIEDAPTLFTEDSSLIRLLSRKDITAAVSKLNNESNIYELVRETNSRKLGIFLDTRCYPLENVATVFLNASNYRLYDELHIWLVIGYNLSNILKVVSDQAFGISTDFVIAVGNGSSNYKLYDLYNKFKDRNGTLNITFYGGWNEHNRLNINLVQSKSARRSNLHGLKLKAMFFQSSYKPDHMPLAEYYEQSKNGIKDGRSKYGYMILKHLGDLYNFSFECFETKTWARTDMLGPLARSLVTGEADFSGTPMNMNHKRIDVLKYVHMGLPFRTCFIFRNPQPTTIKVHEIFRPFASHIWYFTCLVMGLGILLLSLTLRNDKCGSKINRISNSFTVTLGAICQQSTDVHINQYSTRIIFISIMLFSLVMYNYYSACVVSARLDEPIYKINDSLVEFAKMRIKMASERITYMEFFFKAPFWETKVFYEHYWLKYPETKKFMEPEMGLKLVQEGGFAYHVHPDVGYTIIERTYDNREICELTEIHLAKPSITMFGVTNNCTFTELVRIGLTRISETGLRRRQILKWFYRRPRCRKDILSASSINIYEFAPHLVLLVIGMLLSVFIYLIEVLASAWIIEILPRSNMYARKRRLTIRRSMV